MPHLAEEECPLVVYGVDDGLPRLDLLLRPDAGSLRVTLRGGGHTCSLRDEEAAPVAVTPSFKAKTECIDHVCTRIKLHTRLDIMNTKNSATRIKSYYKP
jgi:hypothetical protein